MLPTFQDKDYLITDKFSYKFTHPKRGDVVIIKIENEDKYIIKRVIGIPGDTLNFEAPKEENNFKSQLLINGKPQKETYIKESMVIPQDYSYKVGNDEVFVLGDNRNKSADSRVYGEFSYDAIKGKVVLELKDTYQFHTNPTPYIIVFAIAVFSLLIYLFYPLISKIYGKM